MARVLAGGGRAVDGGEPELAVRAVERVAVRRRLKNATQKYPPAATGCMLGPHEASGVVPTSGTPFAASRRIWFSTIRAPIQSSPLPLPSERDWFARMKAIHAESGLNVG